MDATWLLAGPKPARQNVIIEFLQTYLLEYLAVNLQPEAVGLKVGKAGRDLKTRPATTL